MGLCVMRAVAYWDAPGVAESQAPFALACSRVCVCHCHQPGLFGAAARADAAAVRPRVLHGVRGGVAGEGRLKIIPMPAASSG